MGRWVPASWGWRYPGHQLHVLGTHLKILKHASIEHIPTKKETDSSRSKLIRLLAEAEANGESGFLFGMLQINPGPWTRKTITVIYSSSWVILVKSLITFWCADQTSMLTYWHVSDHWASRVQDSNGTCFQKICSILYDYIWLRISEKVRVEQ